MGIAAETCSQCGWTFDADALRTNTCRKCRSVILVTSAAYLEGSDPPAIRKYVAQYQATLRDEPHDRDAMLGLGICSLKLGQFEQAARYLGQLIDAHPADASGYFYRSVCVFKGKRPGAATLAAVRAAEQDLLAAAELDPACARFALALAAVRYDYYVVNGMRVPAPAPDEVLASAIVADVPRRELEEPLHLFSFGERTVGWFRKALMLPP
jgi:tetratricopeptide (TPR) repeat protein